MNDFTPSEWHAIRPWRPTLALSVREITSVSVTFILASPYTSTSDPTPHDRRSSSDALFANREDNEEEEEEGHKAQIVSEILSQGLSVNVNGIPWQRVLIRIDDATDEAVIILFGLMPGRQYDVELGVVAGLGLVRGQITTVETETTANSDSSHSETLSDDASAISTSAPSSTSSQMHPSSPHPTSTNSTQTAPSPTIPASAPAPLTPEQRRQELTLALSTLTAEHAQLTAALKAARREAQKADASVRGEIEALRRAAERGAANEHRARQKVLALKEARKQTEAAASAMEEARLEIERSLPELERKVREVERELETVKVHAEEQKHEREEVEGREKRRREGWATEVGALTKTLEKLTVKREKLEGGGEGDGGGTISELEEKLRRLEEEREKIERDPYGYEVDTSAKGEADSLRGVNEGSITEHEGRGSARHNPDGSSSHTSSSHSLHTHHHHRQHHPGNTPHQPTPHHGTGHSHPRKRHSHPHSHPNQLNASPSFPSPDTLLMSRPDAIPPIQRPAHSARLSLPSHRDLSAGPGVIHLHSTIHKPGLGAPAQGRISGQVGSRAHSNSGSGSGRSSSASSPVPVPQTQGTHVPTPSASGSNLSGRAPPFEPSGFGIRPGTVPTSGPAIGKSELNPGSNPFSPKSAVAQAVALIGNTRTRAGGGST
ncbi:uncharacterized protein FIBRA_02759 [Fibroporia radiculosa]|uniref:Uncharacterized protein n=1 Tax=Fibroporia radiculosa TaxID=599839 RepID=J4H212_9APHY|nr:uncharacterized protein FIBRA_02759 [Fibroporia radiculosa]CCM00719.1 predicted protein [Fibroporia radiculosa]